MKLIVNVYVNDLVITGVNDASIGEFKKEMCMLFKISDAVLLNLGLKVKQGKTGITLYQAAYAGNLLDKRVSWGTVTPVSH